MSQSKFRLQSSILTFYLVALGQLFSETFSPHQFKYKKRKYILFEKDSYSKMWQQANNRHVRMKSKRWRRRRQNAQGCQNFWKWIDNRNILLKIEIRKIFEILQITRINEKILQNIAYKWCYFKYVYENILYIFGRHELFVNLNCHVYEVPYTVFLIWLCVSDAQ